MTSMLPGDRLHPPRPAPAGRRDGRAGGAGVFGTSTATDTDPRLAWHRLLQISRLVLRELERRLNESNQIGATELDALMALEDAEDHRLRMSDLAEAVMLSAAGATRLIDRLERRGLVQRIQDPSDRRALHATLTDAGSERVAEARVTYDAVIDELVGANPNGHGIG